MRTYREIFARPEFRALFLARCVTMAAVSIGGLALGTTTYTATGSPVLTALAMFRNVAASTGPESGALFIGGAASVCADESGDKSSRDAMTMPTASDATARSNA